MPPAFTLSQDQTLKFISIIIPTQKVRTTIPQEVTPKSLSPTSSQPKPSPQDTSSQGPQPHPGIRPKPNTKTPATHPTPQSNHATTSSVINTTAPQNKTNPNPTHHNFRRDSQIKRTISIFQKTRCNFQRTRSLDFVNRNLVED